MELSSTACLEARGPEFESQYQEEKSGHQETHLRESVEYASLSSN